jgi:GDP-D-mannose dehydratase
VITRRASTLKPARLLSRLTRVITARLKSSKHHPCIFSQYATITVTFSLLLGNPAKAEKLLHWKRKVDFPSLVKEMVDADLQASSSLIENQN